MTKSYSFIFDLDGVIADWRHRLMLQGEAFYDAMLQDPLIPAGAVLYNMLVTQAQIIGHAVQIGKVQGAEVPFVDIMTCRPERMRMATMQWFAQSELLAPRRLLMREDLDVRDHHIIKMQMYREYYEGKEEVIIMFEDNKDTIKAFRNEGITVYQVCESPFN